jgi:hypothetical protein
MYSTIFFLLTLGIVLIVLYFMKDRYGDEKDDSPSDFEVLEVTFDPPIGTRMIATQRVVVSMHYRYSSPRIPLHFWVKPVGANQAGSYEPSSSSLKPGTGWARRYVSLEGEGRFLGVELIASKRNMSDVHRQHIEAEYHYAADPALETLRDDGINATILAMRLNPPTNSTIAAETEIEVEIHYDVPSERGVDLWVRPATTLKSSYCDSIRKISGRGTVKRSFMVAEPCTLEAIEISMRNTAGVDVYRETVAVEYRIV